MLGTLDYASEDLAGTLRAVVSDDCVDRLEPLAGLDRVDVGARAVGAVSERGHVGDYTPGRLP